MWSPTGVTRVFYVYSFELTVYLDNYFNQQQLISFTVRMLHLLFCN